MKKKAMICNLLIVIFEVIALILYMNRNHTLSLEFYTMDSNILALITSILFLVFYKKEYKWINNLRFITTSCLMVTFIVVVTVLIPVYKYNYQDFLLRGSMLYLHILCPVISTISYIFFEKKSQKNYLGVVSIIVYDLILITLNLLKIVDGPYPFLRIYEQSVLMSIIWFILITGGCYIIGVLLNKLNDKTKGANN